MNAMRTRLTKLEAATPSPDRTDTSTADFLDWCLASHGLDPRNLPPLTREEMDWCDQVLQSAARTS